MSKIAIAALYFFANPFTSLLMQRLIQQGGFKPSNYPKEPEKKASFDTMIGLNTGIASVRL